VDVAVCGLRDLQVAGEEGDRGGVALGGVAKGGKDVPRGGYREKECSAGDGVQGAEPGEGRAEAVGKYKVGADDGDREDDADEALGQQCQGAGRGEDQWPAARWGGLGF